MKIHFLPLMALHFPLLLKWLEAPHVKKWWDQEVSYTSELVKEKYGPCISSLDEFKQLRSPRHAGDGKHTQKKVHAYVIALDKENIGYIQAYNARDFEQEDGLNLGWLSGSVCGVDVLIGNPNFLYKGMGVLILAKFEKHILAPHFDWCLVDPAIDNKSAIKAFEKAGFTVAKQLQADQKTGMIKKIKGCG